MRLRDWKFDAEQYRDIDRLHRSAILVELNPEYAAMAKRRIEGESRLYQPHIAEAAARLLDESPAWASCPWDAPSACVCRVDDGIPDRVVDTERFGNAVIPQIPEVLGRALLQGENLK